jgi:hypothetical protein
LLVQRHPATSEPWLAQQQQYLVAGWPSSSAGSSHLLWIALLSLLVALARSLVQPASGAGVRARQLPLVELAALRPTALLVWLVQRQVPLQARLRSPASSMALLLMTQTQ